MGCGKTSQLKNFINDNPDASFLVVSSRISLSHSQQGLLPNFDHYSDRTWKSRRLIVQYESIHNLTKFYDYVILDEIRSVLTCMTSVVTNKVHIRTNANILRKLMLDAKLTIALDADMEVDEAVPYFFSSIYNPKTIHVVRYTRTRIKRTLRFTKDEVLFCKVVEDALLAGQKVAIGCQSKARALMWQEFLRKRHKGLVFTSDSPDKDILLLRDINSALSNSQYVILTSKVTCGCDHTNKWDLFCIDAGGPGMGCPARNLLQQLGRFRCLRDPEVLVLISTHTDNRSISPKLAHSDVMHELQSRRKLLQCKYQNMLAFDVENKNGDLQLSPDWLSTIFAYNKAENNVNFSSSLAEQAKNKGFEVIFDEGNVQRSRNCQESMAHVKESESDLLRRIYHSIEFDKLQSIIKECEDAINVNESNKDIREKLCICKLLSI